MSNYRGRADEAERREEHRELRDPIGITRLNPGFAGAGPLSYQDRQPSGLPPSFVVSDGSSGEESGECWMSNNFDNSSSSGWENSSMVAQMPTPAPPPSLSFHPTTIEISPGVHVRLRGADETWKAVENDFYMPAECICCESTIFCIQNADYILCPDCRVVSRMEDPSSHGMGGVGLGFKYEDLARWQESILRDQLSRRPHV
jgi:hypothetical protein